nr:origin recognition complex subunit 5 [Quercus suber]
MAADGQRREMFACEDARARAASACRSPNGASLPGKERATRVDKQLCMSNEAPKRKQKTERMGMEQLPDELHRLPSHPSTIVAYGPHATGKTGVLQAYLEAQRSPHVLVPCKECVTGRHLLERTAAAVHQAVQADLGGTTEPFTGRCESLSALNVHLQTLLRRRDRFVLVFDDVDRQRDAPPALLPALARLGEFIPNLTTILIVQFPSAGFLHRPGASHIHFAPYTRAQSIHILSQSPPDIFLATELDKDYDQETHDEDKAWLWPRFCAAVWDSLAQNAARDLVAYRTVCHKLWRPFVTPIIKGDFGTRDFSRLLVNQRRLFQDESVLLDSIIPPTASTTTQPQSHELPYYAKWLLISAYLSSFNPPRMDAVYFMKASEKKRRKKGGGTARAGGGGRPSQTRKVPRHLLAPAAFPLDRLLAILHAILPHDLRGTLDVATQLATLTSLRLLVRGGGLGGSDPLLLGGKWKVGAPVTLEYAQHLARGLEFPLLDYLAE